MLFIESIWVRRFHDYCYYSRPYLCGVLCFPKQLGIHILDFALIWEATHPCCLLFQRRGIFRESRGWQRRTAINVHLLYQSFSAFHFSMHISDQTRINQDTTQIKSINRHAEEEGRMNTLLLAPQAYIVNDVNDHDQWFKIESQITVALRPESVLGTFHGFSSWQYLVHSTALSRSSSNECAACFRKVAVRPPRLVASASCSVTRTVCCRRRSEWARVCGSSFWAVMTFREAFLWWTERVRIWMS